MASVSCPNCDEDVRLPSTNLPEGFSAQCPWCAETFPASNWIAKLPPAVQLIDSNGVAIDWSELNKIDANSQLEQGEDVTDDGASLDVEEAIEVDSLELEIEPFVDAPDVPIQAVSNETSKQTETGDPPSRLEDAPLEQTETGSASSNHESNEEHESDALLLLAQPADETSEDSCDVSQENTVCADEDRTDFVHQVVDSETLSVDDQDTPNRFSDDQLEDTPSAGLSDREETTDPVAADELPNDEFAVERYLEENVFRESNEIQESESDFDEGQHEQAPAPTTERRRVPLASEAEQLSYYQRHEWTRESRGRRALRYLVPALILLPIVGAAFAYAVGPSNLGLSFLGDLNSMSAWVRGGDDDTKKSRTDTLPTSLSDSIVAANDQDEPSANIDSAIAASAVEGLASLDIAPDGSNESDSAEPSKIDSAIAEQSADSPYQSAIEDIDALVDSMIEGVAPSNPSTEHNEADASVDTAQKTGTSIADLMRDHSDRVAAERARRRSPEFQRRNQENSLMLFPREAPTVVAKNALGNAAERDAAGGQVKQASAVNEIERPATPEANSNSDLKDLPDLPAEISEVTLESPKDSAPDTYSLWAVPKDSSELELVCRTAVLSLQRIEKILGSTDPADAKWKQTALVRAYRDVAIVGSKNFDAYSVAVSKVMSQIAKYDVLAAMEPLGTAWIDYPKRKTDGILLIGKLNGDGRSGTLELPSGSVFDVQYDGVALADGEVVFAIGLILSKGSTPQVRLVAGNMVPSPP